MHTVVQAEFSLYQLLRFYQPQNHIDRYFMSVVDYMKGVTLLCEQEPKCVPANFCV